MEKLLNNKKGKVNMKKLSILFTLLLMVTMGNVFAQDEEVLRWQFEEGGGTIVLDTSGNSNHGSVLGGRWQTGGDAKFGTYGFDFDNNNDIIETISELDVTDNYSISFWLKPDRDNEIDTFYEIYDDSGNVFLFRFNDSITNNWVFSYNDSTGTIQEEIVDTFTPITGTWYHLVLAMDFENDVVDYYRDNVLISSTNLTTDLSLNQTSAKSLRLGGLASGEFYDGDMDEFRIYNMKLNSSQVNQLTTNTLPTFDPVTPVNETPDESIINGSQEFDIILSHYPSNYSNVTIPVSISANLNVQASCDIYVDNQFVTSFKDVLAFNHVLSDISVGEHTYFLYCSLVDGNNILNYEITNITTFYVDLGEPSTIQFIFSSTDFDVNSLGLYVTTPCLERGIFVPTISNGYNQRVTNDVPVYFQRVTNNYATFQIPQGDHEFCLINGRVVYDANNFTEGWVVNDIYKNLNLGEYSIPNNITTSFVISLENLDVYKPWNPKAWGQTWTSIISSLLAFLTGIGLIFIGLIDKENPNPQLMLVGGLLVMFALGYQISNIVLGVLF